MKNLLLVVGLVMVAGAQAGCGGGGSASCGNVQPCGGSVVGTWNVVSTCIDQASLNTSLKMTCPQASVSENVQETGTVTFNADLSYVAALSASATFVESIPTSCIAPLTCADLASLGQNPTPDAGVMQSLTCTGTTVCNCQGSLSQSNVTASGTYATSGTMLTVTPANGTASADSYCVQGNTLHLTSSTAANMTGQATTASELVLQRQ